MTFVKLLLSHAGPQSVCSQSSLTVRRATSSPLTWHPRLAQRESGVLRLAARQPSCVALCYANQGWAWRRALWRLPGKVRGACRPSLQRDVCDADISAQSSGRSLFGFSHSLCGQRATRSPKILVSIKITESAHHVLGSDADLSNSLMLLDSLVGHSDS